jgi:hypothetical protein
MTVLLSILAATSGMGHGTLFNTVLLVTNRLTAVSLWGILHLFVIECYPCRLRATASGTANIFSRIGAIFATFAATDLVIYGACIFMAVSALSGFASVLLMRTETNGKAIEATGRGLEREHRSLLREPIQLTEVVPTDDRELVDVQMDDANEGDEGDADDASETSI